MRVIGSVGSVLVAALLVAHGGQAASRKKTNTIARPSYASAATAIDCSNAIQALPKVRGLSRAFEALASRPALKTGVAGRRDEFENDEAYHDRLDRIWRSPLGGTDRIIIEKSLSPLDVSFNANRYELEVANVARSDADHRLWNGNAPFWLTTIGSSLSGRNYTASNAFGISASVRSITGATVSLMYLPLVERGPLRVRKYGSYDLVFNVHTDDARRFKQIGKLVIVARAKSPFVFHKRKASTATLDDPVETRTSSYGLHVEVECIIAVAGDKEIGRYE